MATRTPEPKGTDKFKRQGHTASDYGSEPTVKGRKSEPRELKAGK